MCGPRSRSTSFAGTTWFPTLPLLTRTVTYTPAPVPISGLLPPPAASLTTTNRVTTLFAWLNATQILLLHNNYLHTTHLPKYLFPPTLQHVYVTTPAVTYHVTAGKLKGAVTMGALERVDVLSGVPLNVTVAKPGVMEFYGKPTVAGFKDQIHDGGLWLGVTGGEGLLERVFEGDVGRVGLREGEEGVEGVVGGTVLARGASAQGAAWAQVKGLGRIGTRIGGIKRVTRRVASATAAPTPAAPTVWYRNYEWQGKHDGAANEIIDTIEDYTGYDVPDDFEETVSQVTDLIEGEWPDTLFGWDTEPIVDFVIDVFGIDIKGIWEDKSLDGVSLAFDFERLKEIVEDHDRWDDVEEYVKEYDLDYNYDTFDRAIRIDYRKPVGDETGNVLSFTSRNFANEVRLLVMDDQLQGFVEKDGTAVGNFVVGVDGIDAQADDYGSLTFRKGSRGILVWDPPYQVGDRVVVDGNGAVVVSCAPSDNCGVDEYAVDYQDGVISYEVVHRDDANHPMRLDPTGDEWLEWAGGGAWSSHPMPPSTPVSLSFGRHDTGFDLQALYNDKPACTVGFRWADGDTPGTGSLAFFDEDEGMAEDYRLPTGDLVYSTKTVDDVWTLDITKLQVQNNLEFYEYNYLHTHSLSVGKDYFATTGDINFNDKDVFDVAINVADGDGTATASFNEDYDLPALDFAFVSSTDDEKFALDITKLQVQNSDFNYLHTHSLSVGKGSFSTLGDINFNDKDVFDVAINVADGDCIAAVSFGDYDVPSADLSLTSSTDENDVFTLEITHLSLQVSRAAEEAMPASDPGGPANSVAYARRSVLKPDFQRDTLTNCASLFITAAPIGRTCLWALTDRAAPCSRRRPPLFTHVCGANTCVCAGFLHQLPPRQLLVLRPVLLLDNNEHRLEQP